MANVLDLRRRIKGIKNIQKITRAMKMVAAVRLRKAQERVKSSLPYSQGLAQVMAAVRHSGEAFDHPVFAMRETDRMGLLVIGADKGLAGSYGSNLCKTVQQQLDRGNCAGLVTVGRKPRDYFRRRRVAVDQAYIGISEKPQYQQAADIAAVIAELFVSGRYDKVYAVYTRFCSPAVQQVTVEQLLPISREVGTAQPVREQLYDPSIDSVLAAAAVKWLEAAIYSGLVHAAASEVAARLQAMSLATDNAQELISQLVLAYNKVRQANITREISEIVGGAQALR